MKYLYDDINQENAYILLDSGIVGIDIEIQQWSGGNEEKVIDWVDMFLDFFDWGNR